MFGIKFNSFIFPYTKILHSGKICISQTFSTMLHEGTSFFITSNTQIYKRPKNIIKKGELLGLIFFEQIFTGDIVQGLPKIEEILEKQVLILKLVC